MRRATLRGGRAFSGGTACNSAVVSAPAATAGRDDEDFFVESELDGGVNDAAMGSAIVRRAVRSFMVYVWSEIIRLGAVSQCNKNSSFVGVFIELQLLRLLKLNQ